MKDNLNKYLPEISGAIIGLLLAICLLGVGFVKTVFIIAMLAFGGLVGHYWPLLKNLKNR